MTETQDQIRKSKQLIMIMSTAGAANISFIDKRTKRGRVEYEIHKKLLALYSNTTEAINKLDLAQDVSPALSFIIISMLKAEIQIILSNPYIQQTK